MGQLERRYGRHDAARRILNMRAVWVSHMHADHHGGLYALLLQRRRLAEAEAAAAAAANSSSPAVPPLLILGPWPLFKVLFEYQQALPDLKFTFLPNTFFYGFNQRQPPQEVLAAYEAVKEAAGLRTLQAFPVQHVSHSSGLKLEGVDGWKVVFSGEGFSTER
jgi:ribonuclease Z